MLIKMFLSGNCLMDLSKLLQVVTIDTWTSPCCYRDLSKLIHRFSNCCMDLLKLVHGFVKVVTWICQCDSMGSRLWPNKTKLKFDQDFKAC